MGLMEPGTIVAGHRIEGVIGRGGMGVVYLATQIALDRRVALKVIDPALAHDPGFRERFQREARLAAAIDHPNVVAVHHAGEDRGLLYLSMRHVDGTDLRAVLARGPLTPARAAEVVGAVGAALDAAHERGMVHRDVKPANVLIGGDRVLLTDFGVSRLAGAGNTVTGTGHVVGTADYMSPEQALGRELDGRADVYSLTCLLYEALTGAVPYVRDSPIATIAAHAHEPPPRPSAVAPALAPFDPVIARGMATEPGDRYPTAGALAAAARAAADAVPAAAPAAPATAAAGGGDPGATVPPTRVTPPPPPPSPTPVTTPAAPARRRRGPALVAAGVLAAVVAAVVAGLLLAGTGGDDAAADAPAQPPADVPAGDKSATPTSACDAPVPIGPNPFWVVVGHGSVWASAGDEGLVRRIDPATCAVIDEIDVGDLPGGLAVSRTGVFVALDADGDVGRIDPATGAFTVRARGVVAQPRGMIARGGTVWVVGTASNTLARVDAVNGRPLGAPIPVGRAPRGVAFSRSAIWVTLEGEDRVAVVSAADGRALDPTGGPIRVGERPRGIGGSAEAVWAASWPGGTVTRIDGRTGATGAPIRVGDDPAQVAVGEGGVWVTGNGDATVSRIDPATQSVVATIPVPPRPRGITVGAGAVWVVSAGAEDGDQGLLTRIDPSLPAAGGAPG